MGDDAVGIHVVRMLKQRFAGKSELDFKELSVGGLRLVEEMLGYERVFLVDSIATDESKIGQIQEFSPDEFEMTEQSSSPHVTNFATALEFYRRLEPEEIPKNVKIFTIGMHSEFTFREGLSPRVNEAALKVTDLIAREIERV
jgi:hydrogenase maturation protease